MASVVPTVLASTPADFQTRLLHAEDLSFRVHIDISDGTLAPGRTVNLPQVYVKQTKDLDLHLMVADPDSVLETAFSLHPSLIIIHAEAEGSIGRLIKVIQDMGVKAGVALLPHTKVESVHAAVEKADHVLIFTGNLGYNGGSFNAAQLRKVPEIRAINHKAEISVDGGVNAEVAGAIVAAGVGVLYCGSYLAAAKDPGKAYADIQHAIGVPV